MLNNEQVGIYNAEGYIIVKSIVPDDALEELRDVTETFVDRSRSVGESDEVFDLEPGHSANEPRLRRLKRPAEQHPIYSRWLRNDTILDIVAQLIGPGIRYTGQKLNMKSASFGSPVEWHQDWVFIPQTNDDLLTVGIALDDMTVENGCLMVIPESHRGRLYDHHQDGRFVGAVTEPDFDPSSSVRSVEIEAGDISIHHFRLLHASAPNRSRRPRRLLLFEYAAIDAWPLAGISDWDEFNSRILRGDPTNQPRLEPVPVIMPVPPAERQGSIYENQTILRQRHYKTM